MNDISELPAMKFSIPIQIRFRDLDGLQHVNNVVFLSYVEQTRVAYFNKIVRNEDWHRKSLILAKNEINYLAPVYLTDEITSSMSINKVGTKSITTSFKIERLKDGEKEVVAFGYGVLVCMDYGINESIPVPQEWVDRISAFEGIDMQ